MVTVEKFYHDLLAKKVSHFKNNPCVSKLYTAVKDSMLEPLITLGNTLDSWKDEAARMFRFTKSNGITEGFHNKMEMISRRAYGFRNFENYRLRVRALCCWDGLPRYLVKSLAAE